jgi:sugar lactone lactonase YvrE
MAGEETAPGIVTMISPDGSAQQVADGLSFPNSMLVIPDAQTLIVAESYVNKLTAFETRPMAACRIRGSGPSSAMAAHRICADAENAPGTRTSPTSVACIREGGRGARHATVLSAPRPR